MSRGFVGAVVLAIFALVVIVAATYLAPRCKPENFSFRIGGMLLGGCDQ